MVEGRQHALHFPAFDRIACRIPSNPETKEHKTEPGEDLGGPGFVTNPQSQQSQDEHRGRKAHIGI